MKTVKNILAIGNENLIVNVRGGATIYKNELFVGLTDKEKKSIRVKLRRKLDNFQASALAYRKDKNKLDQLKKDWFTYAKEVYTDIQIIVDSNANELKRNSIKDFLVLMNETEKNVSVVKK